MPKLYGVVENNEVVNIVLSEDGVGLTELPEGVGMGWRLEGDYWVNPQDAEEGRISIYQRIVNFFWGE